MGLYLQEEERPYIALIRSRIPHTFQSIKGFGHHILKSSDRKKQVVNKIWRPFRNLLAEVHDKNLQRRPSLYFTFPCPLPHLSLNAWGTGLLSLL